MPSGDLHGKRIKLVLQVLAMIPRRMDDPNCLDQPCRLREAPSGNREDALVPIVRDPRKHRVEWVKVSDWIIGSRLLFAARERTRPGATLRAIGWNQPAPDPGRNVKPSASG